MLHVANLNPSLKQWNRTDYLLYFVVVPAILMGIYLLPYSIKEAMILDVQNPTPLSVLMSNYVHTDMLHFLGNFSAYFMVMLAIFSLNVNKRVFMRVAPIFFIILPVISSIILVAFMKGGTSQGFSAIVAGWTGYLVYVAYGYVKANFHKELTANFASMLVIANFTIWALIGGQVAYLYPLLGLSIIMLFINRKPVAKVVKHLLFGFNPFKKQTAEHALYNCYWAFVFCIAIVMLLSGYDMIGLAAWANGVNILAHYTGYVMGIIAPALVLLPSVLKK